ncbi:hypothetical protein G8764_05315 [Pseudomaricurvus alcaniphilus]|uniref:transglutaminase domain-containing protein n=1 Tax=Pseudomaricurvus alcaniphilus TaxID=1166482 RepID=UPI001409E637|nr:transglutaminase domain-containing protein [Pseudomaricurvus alcaniphilus]NHN36708.1 hypothetical protein [Pseudomaricurvus alcaniphilus]
MNNKRWAVLVLALMSIIAFAVVRHAGSGKNGTLVRNSLIAQPLPESAFSWKPGAEPADFKLETREPETWMQQRIAAIDYDSDGIGQVKAVISAMHAQPFVGHAIQKDLRSTWRLIAEHGLGYCADYSKLFTAQMLAAGIPVREWALGHKDFGSGHTFNEVYIDGQWIFVDSFNGMLIQDRETGAMLSVLQFRNRLAQKNIDSIEVIKLTDPRYFFQTREEALNYYARSSDFFYLMWGNNVFSYDSHPVIQRAADIGRPLERLVAILVNQYPQIRLLETETNSAAIAEMRNLRLVLYSSLIVELLLGLCLIRLCWKIWRDR